MAKKSLNRNNLTDLGAEALAELVLDIVKGNAALQRRVRLRLNADAGPGEAASEVRKRFASIRRSGSFIDWHQQRGFARELSELIDLIEKHVAPAAPSDAFDLLWAFLQLAPNIHERTDDSNGTIGSVMDDAMEAIADLAPRLDRDPETLAEMIYEALADNGYGEFDGAIPALGEALGQDGLEHLKALANSSKSEALTPADFARYDFVYDTEQREKLARDGKDRTANMILQDVADEQGDVDAYMARYTAEQLTFHTIAPDIAARLLAAGRAEEALKIVENSRAQEAGRNSLFGTPNLDRVYIDCLESLGRAEELTGFLWQDFCDTLNADSLRRYLKTLPDFEDIEAEEEAKTIAAGHADPMAALRFFIEWPDLPSGARLVQTRYDEMDGNAYYVLTPAADALDHEQPLAAILLRRAMIVDTLKNGRSKRYGYAARHLKTCRALSEAVEGLGQHPDHDSFVNQLHSEHGRKSSFWARVE